MYFKHNLVTSHSFDISETFVKLSPICRNRAGLCRTAHWSLETRPYRFTLKKPFSTRGSFPAFCLFPPDRTHLPFISPSTVSPVLLELSGPASGGQVLHCPLAHPSMGNYPRERRQLGTLEWWSSEQGTAHSKRSETPQLLLPLPPLPFLRGAQAASAFAPEHKAVQATAGILAQLECSVPSPA